MPIGPLELAIVLLIVLIIFGPKRLPGLGRSLGSGMREFKDSITGKTRDDDDEDVERPELRAAEIASASGDQAAEADASRDQAAEADASREPSPRG